MSRVAVATSVAETKPAVASRGVLQMAVQALGSMRLSVVLVVALGLLTWFGTLAQVDRGLFDVQREYFESWYVIADLQLSFWGNPLFLRDDGTIWGLKIPLPGAYPVMALLFVNLLVGGMLRLRWQVRNLGVLVTHIGIALLLVAGFVKLHYSFSGHLSLYEQPKGGAAADGRVHESATFVSFHDYELALLREVGESIEERVVPETMLLPARSGAVVTLRAAGLPFTVQVHDWLDNCRPLPKGPMVAATTPVVKESPADIGAFLKPEKPAREREQNIAGCYVKIVPNEGPRTEAILWGAEMRPFERSRFPFTFTVQGQRYGLDLRRVVYDLPFAVRLDEFQKRDHPGTMTPRDFRSFVTVKDAGEERQQQIYMNTPLRKEGYVLYQTNWGPQQGGGPPWYSVFEVAKNPSDVWPTIACFVIAGGMLLHFARKLHGFLLSSTRKALKS